MSIIVRVGANEAPFTFFVHIQKRDVVMINDSYQVPCVDKCINLLKSATIFSTLDANSGKFQVNIPGQDSHKSSSTSTMTYSD